VRGALKSADTILQIGRFKRRFGKGWLKPVDDAERSEATQLLDRAAKNCGKTARRLLFPRAFDPMRLGRAACETSARARRRRNDVAYAT